MRRIIALKVNENRIAECLAEPVEALIEPCAKAE